MTVEYCWEPEGIYIRFSGSITGVGILAAALDASGDPRFDDISYALVDLFDARSSTVNAEDMKQMAAYVSAMSLTNPRIKNAIVMFPDNEERSALAALYQMLTDNLPWEIKLFETLDAAREWTDDR